MSEKLWMVRAGQGGYLFEAYARGFVGIGWEELGDLAVAPFTEAEIKELYSRTYPEEKAERAATDASIIHQFRSVMEMGHKVTTYNQQTKEYLIGTVGSGYIFRPGDIPDRAHLREVNWEGTVSREALSAVSRESLRSSSSFFQIEEEVSMEMLALLAGQPILTPQEIAVKQIKRADVLRKRKNRGLVTVGFGVFVLALGVFLYIYAHGQIDYLKGIDPEEMETATFFLWFGTDVQKDTPEYNDALDVLNWLKQVGLGVAIFGSIMMSLGAIRAIFTTSEKLRRII